MTAGNAIIFIAMLILIICTALLLKVMQSMKAEIRELWESLSNVCNMLHEDEETIHMLKSRLAVHREVRTE